MNNITHQISKELFYTYIVMYICITELYMHESSLCMLLHHRSMPGKWLPVVRRTFWSMPAAPVGCKLTCRATQALWLQTKGQRHLCCFPFSLPAAPVGNSRSCLHGKASCNSLFWTENQTSPSKYTYTCVMLSMSVTILACICTAFCIQANWCWPLNKSIHTLCRSISISCIDNLLVFNHNGSSMLCTCTIMRCSTSHRLAWGGYVEMVW